MHATSLSHGETPWMLLEPRPGSAAPYTARFESVGVKLPARTLTTADLMASTRHHTSIDLARLTGIRERRVCSPGEDSFTLAVGAAKDCLSRSRYEAEDLDMIVCASITRYVGGATFQLEPPLGLAIKEAIGAHQAMDLDLSNACAGMLTGVFLVNDLVRRGVIRRGMVVSGEFISGLGTNAAKDIRNVMSRQLASLTLGDAGAAVIVDRAEGNRPGIALAAFTTIAEHSRLCVGAPAPHAPGGRMFTRARTIHKVAMQDAPPLLEQLLDTIHMKVDEIDWLVPHQTSARALKAGERAIEAHFGAKPKHLVVNVEEFGNTSSTTHFVALHRLLDEGKLRAGEKVCLLALASGLEIGVVMLVLDELVETHGRVH